MRSAPFGVVVVLAGSLAAGAAGSKEPVFSIANLPGLVAPKPPLPEKTRWAADTTKERESRAFALADSWLFNPANPSMDTVRRAGFRRGYRRVWSADNFKPNDDRQVRGFALLFGTAAGARTALATMRADSLRRAPAVGGRVLRWHEFGAGSLGEAATGKKPHAVYEWRVGNVVLVADAGCGGAECQFQDVTAVAHAYARVLDAGAKRAS